MDIQKMKPQEILNNIDVLVSQITKWYEDSSLQSFVELYKEVDTTNTLAKLKFAEANTDEHFGVYGEAVLWFARKYNLMRCYLQEMCCAIPQMLDENLYELYWKHTLTELEYNIMSKLTPLNEKDGYEGVIANYLLSKGFTTNMLHHRFEISNAQEQILERVNTITQTTPSGPAFFDAMDKEIIEKATPEIMNELFKMVPKDYIVVLSGGFGKKIADGIDNQQYPFFTYTLYKGGIRSGGGCELVRCNFVARNRTDGHTPEKAIFLDDSVYGGKTFYILKQYLVKCGIEMNTAAVIYDGYPQERPEIFSVFRYYDFFEAKPNFSLPDDPEKFFTTQHKENVKRIQNKESYQLKDGDDVSFKIKGGETVVGKFKCFKGGVDPKHTPDVYVIIEYNGMIYERNIVRIKSI